MSKRTGPQSPFVLISPSGTSRKPRRLTAKKREMLGRALEGARKKRAAFMKVLSSHRKIAKNHVRAQGADSLWGRVSGSIRHAAVSGVRSELRRLDSGPDEKEKEEVWNGRFLKGAYRFLSKAAFYKAYRPFGWKECPGFLQTVVLDRLLSCYENRPQLSKIYDHRNTAVNQWARLALATALDAVSPVYFTWFPSKNLAKSAWVSRALGGHRPKILTAFLRPLDEAIVAEDIPDRARFDALYRDREVELNDVCEKEGLDPLYIENLEPGEEVYVVVELYAGHKLLVRAKHRGPLYTQRQCEALHKALLEAEEAHDPRAGRSDSA